MLGVSGNAPQLNPSYVFDYCKDGSVLFVAGVYVTAKEPELFGISNFTAADQTASTLLVQDVPVNGNVGVFHTVP